MYVYICKYMCTFMCLCIRMHACMYVHACMYECVFEGKHVCILFVYMNVCVYVICVFVRMYECIRA